MKSTARRKRDLKLYVEDVKSTQTSHWDWDFLSRHELDRLTQQRPTTIKHRLWRIRLWLREKTCALLPVRQPCEGVRSRLGDPARLGR